MSHIHYKFSSKLSYNTVVFDDVNITLSELKRLIMSREKLRAADCDLQITNAQTKEEYTDDDSPIPKGSSVIVRRIPSRGGKSISKSINSQRAEAFTSSYGFFRSPMDGQKSTGVLPIFSKMANIASSDCSEDDKIKTMMSQSFYDSANYKCGTPLPANYTCYRCGSSEHHIRNCPVTLDRNAEPGVKIKKSTGIPRSFMVKVDDPSIKGAMLTNTGDYAVPAIDAEVYAACKKKTVVPESQIEEPPDAPIPDELMCLICKDLLNDAVVIPCCGNSYCDDCIRSALLDSEDHVCPTCNQSDVSPDALIANKFLRQAVNNFTKEQISIQSLKNTCSTSRSQDSSLRPSPAPTPPLPSQPDKSQVELMVADKPTDSPPCSASPSLIVVKISDDIPDKEVDLKTDRSPEESPSVFVSESVSEADTCDSVSQSIPLVSSVTQAVTDESQSDQAPLWDGSASASPSEGWTAISTVPTHSTSTSFSPNVTPHIQMYLSLQQQLHNPYSPAFTTTTPSWTSGPSPQGAPVPTFTSAASIPPLLPKDLMLYHRRNKERTPPRGSSYQSYHYSSKSLRSKSSSRSPSQSRSHHRSRPYSPHSSHRGTSSHSSHSYSHSNKRSHSPIPTSSPRSHSQRRSRSPADHFKSRHHTSRSSPSCHNSSRRRESSHRPREAPDWNLDEYLRRKQEYKDWCEKYFNSYFSHFHQMPPPPLMPPPQPHWPTSYPHKGPSPPSSDSLTSQSHSASSTSNSHSASSYSDNHSTPTLSFSDSNSPLSDDCARASQEPLKVSRHRDKDEDQNKRESGKQNTEDYTPLKSPLKKLDKHLKSKGEHKRKRDQKLSDKEKERRSEGKEDGSRESGRSRSSDSRSDKSRKRKKHEDYQRKNILIEQSPRCDPPPKVFEREKPKKSAWKPQPLTKENAWEGSMTVKMPQKININIHLDAKKTESDVEEAKKMVEEVEGHTSVNPFCNQSDKAIKHENDVEGQLIPDEGVRDEKNDSWEICPEDEVVGDDSDLWHCALTTLEEEELKQGKETEVKRVTEEDGKPQIREDIRDCERKRDETPSTTKDCSSWTVGPSGDLTVSEEQQKTVVKCLEKHMDKSLLEKHRERVKVTHSGWDKDGCEKELQSKVSSNYREVKNRTKMRSVKESAEEMANSTSTYGTVVPSDGQHVTDNSFDLDRKQKKRTERVSECRKGEERHRKERESISTFFSTSNKMSTGSSHSFKSILDEKISIKFKESSENRDTEGSSQKIYTDLEMGKSNESCSYSRSHYHHNSRQDPNVHHKWSTPHSDCRDGGRQTPKTSTKDWTSPSPVPPCAQSSLGMALTTSNTEGKNNNERMDKLERLNDGQMYSERSSCSTNENDDAKNERRSKKKHKREKRLTSSDEGKKKKKNKD